MIVLQLVLNHKFEFYNIAFEYNEKKNRKLYTLIGIE